MASCPNCGTKIVKDRAGVRSCKRHGPLRKKAA